MAQEAGIHYTAQLANAVSRNNDTTAIIPEYAETSYFHKRVNIVRLPIPTQLLPSLIKILNPSFFRLLTKIIADLRPEVVHLAFEHRFPFIYAFWLRRKYAIVTTIHEPRAVPNRGRIQNALVALRQYVNNRLLAQFSDKVTIHGVSLKSSRLISKLPGQKIEIVPLGDFSFFAPSYETTPAEKKQRSFLQQDCPI